MGLAPGANIGYGAGIFEAVHGSAPDIAGRGIANPGALILAGAMMLRHLGEADAATRVESAVASVVNQQTFVTRDLSPPNPVSTKEMASAIIRALS